MQNTWRTGQFLFDEDVLHPELGRRGWLSTESDDRRLHASARVRPA